MIEKPHLHRRVWLVKPLGPLPVGRSGICTAELPDEDRYAVYFDEPPDPRFQAQWVTFNFAARSHFVLEENA